MFTWPGEPTRNEPGKGRLKGQQRLPDDNCSGPEVESPGFRTDGNSAYGAQHRKYSRKLIAVGRITAEPPDVWAAFLLHHAEDGSGNCRNQAITLIENSRCKRGPSPAEVSGALVASRHCNEIVMIEGSEPVKSNTQLTKRPALQALKESNKVEHRQNAATPPCVLIIRRS